MNRESLIWLIVVAVGAVLMLGRALVLPNGMGTAYIRDVEKQFVQVDDQWVKADSDEARAAGVTFDSAAPDERREWTVAHNAWYTEYAEAVAADPNQTSYRFSTSRTVGTWAAALLTLFVLSFLIKDNPLYKIAESLFIGVSAAYWMVSAFWDTLVPNLFGKLAPGPVFAWAMPSLEGEAEMELIYIVPLILGVMLLWRLAPKGGWISRWPMAFFIGTFCGMRLITFLHADFLSQIRNGIMSLWAINEAGNFDLWLSLQAVFLFLGVLTCLVYFFFSIEHKGVVGQTARVGIWFLMITFGAAFGYTVMGRIALLAIRLEFLMDDWLFMIDPTEKRGALESAVSMIMAPGVLG